MLLAGLPADGPLVVESLPRSVVASSLSPDRRTAATLGLDGTVALWNIGPDTQAHLMRRLMTPPWPAQGNLGEIMAVSNGGVRFLLRRPTGGFDVWEGSKVVQRVDPPHPDYQWQVRWLPTDDGALIDIGHAPTGQTDATRLLRSDGRTLDLPVSGPWGFTPDGKAVVGGSGKGLALVDLATGQVRRRFADASESTAPFAFSPDGRLLATAGEDPSWGGPVVGPDDPVPTEAAYAHTLKIKVWDVATGRRLSMVDGYFSSNGDGDLRFLDARRLAAPGMGIVFDAPTGRIMKRFESVSSPSERLRVPATPLKDRPVRFPESPSIGRCVAASPDGRLLAASETEYGAPTTKRTRALLVWSVADRRLRSRVDLPEITNLRKVSFSPDGRLLAEGTQPPPPKRRFDKDGFMTIETIQGIKVRVELRLSSTGGLVSRRLVRLPVEPGRNTPMGLFARPQIPSHGGDFTLTQHPARAQMAVDLARVDAKTGKTLWTSSEIDVPGTLPLLSPDDRRFVVSWYPSPLKPEMRSNLSLLDAATGKTVVTVPLGPNVFALAYTADARRLVLFTSEGIQVRDAATLALAARFPERQDSADVGLAALPGGGFATVRQGQDVRIFDAEARLKATLVAFPSSGWAGWTPGGEAWGSPDGLVHLRREVDGRLLPVVPKSSPKGG